MQYEYFRHRINLSLKAQMALAVSAIGALLWVMFFSPIPAAHDFFHASRHSIGILACH
jgi:hypothetical protein